MYHEIHDLLLIVNRDGWSERDESLLVGSVPCRALGNDVSHSTVAAVSTVGVAAADCTILFVYIPPRSVGIQIIGVSASCFCNLVLALVTDDSVAACGVMCTQHISCLHCDVVFLSQGSVLTPAPSTSNMLI